jgi:D-glycero-alpha-D-manno-heptose-7-phosphate kinase
MSGRPAGVRARAPLRLGLAGGGTDLSPYCDTYGGAVLNATIDRYAYAFVEPSDDGMLHFVAPDLQLGERLPLDLAAVGSAQLRLHAGVARRMFLQYAGGAPAPLRITSFVDAPPGSGLGSSSALVVALVEALRAYLHIPLGPYDVAHAAFEIERIELAMPGGKQDQYSAAFGGVNFIEFLAEDRVIVNPLRVPTAIINELETSLITCFVGVSRSSEAIIEEQQRGIGTAGTQALDSMHKLKASALEMKDALLRGDIERLASILNQSWRAKKRTAHSISTPLIDGLYDVAMAEGALGGKVSGAGGGGFMMFVAPPCRRVDVIRALNAAGGTASGVHFTMGGAESWPV